MYVFLVLTKYSFRKERHKGGFLNKYGKISIANVFFLGATEAAFTTNQSKVNIDQINWGAQRTSNWSQLDAFSIQRALASVLEHSWVNQDVI